VATPRHAILAAPSPSAYPIFSLIDRFFTISFLLLVILIVCVSKTGHENTKK
jgi:hypothetical protein